MDANKDGKLTLEVEGLSHVGVAWAECLLLDRECALVESLGFCVFALRAVHNGKAVQRAIP
jgi:hypothetical protein